MQTGKTDARDVRNRSRRRARLWAGVLCVALVGGMAACAAGRAEPLPSGSTEATTAAPAPSRPAQAAPSSSSSQATPPASVGTPPEPEPSVIEEAAEREPGALARHLEALQAAADANGGNRADDTGGYEASAAYVEAQLRSAGYETRRQELSYDSVDTFNILADTDTGSDGLLVIGAHLDSVEEGPGLNDNGSGVAAVLEVALRIAEGSAVPRERIRFAFWGGEEDDMWGSAHYVEELSDAEADEHSAYLNVDVVGSPNAAVFVYDGDGSDTDSDGPDGSAAIEQVFLDIFRAEGVQALPVGFIGDSDYDAFVERDIPTGGLFTGDAGSKSAAEARAFGGQAGDQYDECYHMACDTIDNVDMNVLQRMTEALMSATASLAGIEDAP
jgi:aminopeptidase S